MGNVIKIDDSTFQAQVIDANMPVVVDFGAEWCGPCKSLEPIIEEIATQYQDKAKVCKADIDQANEIASKFGIMAVPTIIFFKNGQEVDRLVGAVSRDKLEEKIQTIL